MVASEAYSVESGLLWEQNSEAAETIQNFLDKAFGCIKMMLEIDSEDFEIERVFQECFPDRWGMRVFVLDDKHTLCEGPNSVLIVPKCSGAMTRKALSTAKSCFDKGDPLVGIIFVTDGTQKSAEKNLKWFWKFARDYGVGALALLFFEIESIVRWHLR